MKQQHTIGFTLIELIVIIGLLSLVSVGVSVFAYQGMKLWKVTQDHVQTQENIRAVFRAMVGEIREMTISDNGSYPIESLDDFSLVFFANVDNDAEREKVKYELVDGTLYRWVAESDGGTPAQYADFSEDHRTSIAGDIINTDYLFRYYDNTYDGTSDPLVEPFDIKDVSLVQVRVVVDSDPQSAPEPVEVETNISLRNLKYKYD